MQRHMTPVDLAGYARNSRSSSHEVRPMTGSDVYLRARTLVGAEQSEYRFHARLQGFALSAGVPAGLGPQHNRRRDAVRCNGNGPLHTDLTDRRGGSGRQGGLRRGAALSAGRYPPEERLYQPRRNDVADRGAWGLRHPRQRHVAGADPDGGSATELRIPHRMARRPSTSDRLEPQLQCRPDPRQQFDHTFSIPPASSASSPRCRRM